MNDEQKRSGNMPKKEYDYKEAAEVLRAIAHPTRLKIIEVLLTEQGCVRQLEQVLKRPQANISQHLTILRKAGIVDFFERGRERCYFLKESSKVRKILNCITKAN